MTISLLAYNSDKNTGVSTTKTINVTVPAGDRSRAVAMGLLVSSAPGNSISSITFGGAAMTVHEFEKLPGSYADYFHTVIASLNLPATGSQDFVINRAAASRFSGTIAIFSRCAGTVPGTKAVSNTSGAMNVAAGKAGDLVVNVMANDADAAPTSSGQTWTFWADAMAGSGGWGAVGTSAMLAASMSQSVSWTMSANLRHVGLSFPEVSSGSARVIMFFEQWRRRTELYRELLNRGAIPLRPGLAHI